MKIMLKLVFLALIALSVMSCPPGLTDYVFEAKFQQGIIPSTGYNGCVDTYISTGAMNNVYDTCSTMIIGNSGGNWYRAVLYFNLTSIPAEATVVKAYLTLTVQYYYGAGITARAYALSTYWWPQTSGCGVDYGFSIDPRWSGPWSTMGGDLSRPMSQTEVVSIPSLKRTLTLDLDPSIVQIWVSRGITADGTQSNSGLLIRAEYELTSGDYCTFYSSNNVTNIDYRPVLTVYYKFSF
ncbi:MAG: DNRLRE domain-containing protein [Spirochaetales bacterium]|nr:DNRLRE domain-containing protein [Spirochaetales bacterium]